MITDVLISPKAINGSRRQKLMSAAGFSIVAGVNGWSAEYGLTQGGIGSTLLAIGNMTAMAATTFSATYSLLSSMESEVTPTVSDHNV